MYFNTSVNEGGYFNGPNSVDTPTQSKEKTVRRLQNVVPVCIRQLRDCKEDEFIMFNMKTQILTLVGILRDYDVTSTKATYTIEDHTGSISAVLWLEADPNSEVNLPSVKEGHYLRLYGSLRTQDDTKSLLVLKMMPIENINEVTTHLLEVAHVRFAAEAMSKDGSLAKIAQNNPGAGLAKSMMVTDTSMAARPNEAFTALQTKTYQCIRANDLVQGVPRATILSNFQKHEHNEVNDAIEFLACEGHIYSTIDLNHFRATNH